MNDVAELKIKNTQLGDIRYAYINGDVWMLGKDVASMLEYKDSDDAIRYHVSEENLTTRKISGSSFSDGKSRYVKFINEAGFYQLSMKSKKPNAVQLQNWISNEVLPSLRKEGHYDINGQTNQFFDSVNELTIDGSNRTQFKNKIKLYANANGIHISDAYNHFDQYYNNKYEVDIKARKRNYSKKHNLKKTIGTPEFLEITGDLDKGFAVIDEMLAYKCHQIGGFTQQEYNVDNQISYYIETDAALRNYAIQNFYAGINSCLMAMIARMNYARVINCPFITFADLPKIYTQFIYQTTDPNVPFCIDYLKANKYVMENINSL